MEISSGVRLSHFIDSTSKELSLFFTVSLGLTKLIKELQQSVGVVRLLNPEHIIVDLRTGYSKLIDGEQDISSKQTNKFAYMSPEQSGRMNRRVDVRSQLYSLGAIYYEMLTGKSPFQACNQMEWVYAHMAILPEPILVGHLKIPPVLNDIVMKLLSKNAEDRYQSPHGLYSDLEHCRNEWMIDGFIAPFLLGQVDLISQFQIPHKLYGRENEILALEQAWKRACSGAGEMVLLSGRTGNGKTALVMEFGKSIGKDGGTFITGKFDQLQQAILYAPFIQAFKQIIKQIVAKNDEQLTNWKHKMLQALGQSGLLIIEVIPELELIIGKQRHVESLPPAEAIVRFQQLFLNFIRVFANKVNPLVLFLDDLQWIDAASLQFLRVLFQSAKGWNLLVIGSYRENEIGDDHELRELWNEDRLGGDSVVRRLPIDSLHISHISILLAETLHRDGVQVRPLAEALFHKTAGNPFYLNQLLYAYYYENLLFFSEHQNKWEWDLELIKRSESLHDVTHLIVERFDRLPLSTRSVLRMAGCLGNSFELSMLCLVCNQTHEQTENDLSPAVDEGLVLPVTGNMSQQTSYTFHHDRVQLAAYHHLSESEIKEIHLKIGRILLGNDSWQHSEELIFITAYHLNLADELIAEPSEKRQVALINLRAGKKAKASTAYDAALDLLRKGAQLIQGEGWTYGDSLYFDLLLELSECEYYCGNFADAEEIVVELMQHANQITDWNKLYLIQINMYDYLNQNKKAIEFGIKAIMEFGLEIPLKPTNLSVMRELLLTWWHTRGKVIPKIDKAASYDLHQNALLSIAIAISAPIITSNPKQAIVLFAKYVRQALKMGHSDSLSFSLSCYALILCLGFGRYKKGLQLMSIALRLAQNSENSSIKGRVFHMMGLVLLYHHPEKSISYFEQAIEYNLESGDLGFGVSSYVINIRRDLRKLYNVCTNYNDKISRCLNPVASRLLQKTRQYILSLQRQTIGPISSNVQEDEPFSEKNLSIVIHYYYCYSLEIEVRYLLGKYADVIELVKRSSKWEEKNNEYDTWKQCFYYFLALVALYEHLPKKERKTYMGHLKKQYRRIRRRSRRADRTAIPKEMLMAAEIARLQSEDSEAINLYERAIVYARENDYWLEEAIACELAGKYSLHMQKEIAAEIYIREACRSYLKWGAVGKVKSLCEAYPIWLTEFSNQVLDWIHDDKATVNVSGDQVTLISQASLMGIPAADQAIGKELDLSTIRKATKIVADGNEDENELIPDLFLDLALSNAGAERGYMVLEKDRGIIVIAQKDVNRSSRTLPGAAAEGEFSASVIQYVLRTREPVVLGEAKWSMFALDPYISLAQPRSILCLPILYPGNHVGAVYLENNLTADAFTADRLEVLDMIFSRMVHLKTLHGQGVLKEEADNEREPLQVQSHPHLIVSLTKREIEILRLMADGLSNKEIAQEFELTEGTIKNHALNIYGKLQVKRRVQAIMKARELRLLD